MKTLWLARKLSKTNLEEATSRYLEELAQAPVQQSRESTSRLLGEFANRPGPKVYLGRTPWGEAVQVPLLELVKAMGLATGGTGAGKTMAALLPLQAIIKQLPGRRTVGFGVLDAKGELRDR